MARCDSQPCLAQATAGASAPSPVVSIVLKLAPKRAKRRCTNWRIGRCEGDLTVAVRTHAWINADLPEEVGPLALAVAL